MHAYIPNIRYSAHMLVIDWPVHLCDGAASYWNQIEFLENVLGLDAERAFERRAC